MNGRLVKNSFVLSMLCLAGTALLSGCASSAVSGTSSPFTSEVQSLVDSHQTYPRLSDFPADPVAVPNDESIRQRVVALEGSQTDLVSRVQGIDWQLDENAEVTAAEIRRLLADMPVEAPTVQTPAEIEAFAQSLRERAKAPPPVDRPMR